EDDEQQGQRQEDLPAEPHQLVIAIAWYRRFHPPEAEEEKEHLDEQPDDSRDPVERRPVYRGQPSAPEDDRVQGAHQDHVGIFAKPEEREAHRRIFGLVAGYELALRLDEVERRAKGLGHRADE